MSSLGINVPSPDDIDYHADRQVRRVQTALKQLDPGDVIAVVESRLAAESDPTGHPLYPMALFFLDRLPAVDGAKLYNDWKQLILAAISTCLDDMLELED